MTVVMRVSGQDVTTVIRLDMFPVLAYLMYVFQHMKCVMDTYIVQVAVTNVCPCVRVTVQVTEDCIHVLTSHAVSVRQAFVIMEKTVRTVRTSSLNTVLTVPLLACSNVRKVAV